MFAIIVVLLLCVLDLSNGQNSIIEEYVQNISTYERQALTWVYPENSYSYLRDNFNPRDVTNDGEYDFIICGVGSSGSVIANRLTEIAGWNVLVLEAGTWENNFTDIPNMVDFLHTTDYNWGYNIASQPNILKGYIDNKFLLPRGKAIGGTSVINAMIYARGNKKDYDKWGQYNPGWSYKDVLPYFKKSENVSFPNADPKYHGTTGTLSVENSRLFDKTGQSFLDANKELGRKMLDYNAAEQMGFSIVQLNEKNGARDSGSKAFVAPVVDRSNLNIITNSLITKLLIHQHKKEVYGVQYIRNGTLHYASARKEVILSAGSINTPQILMLSGIGPRDHLEHLNITVLQELPVGNNLWDHLIYNCQSFAMNYTYNYPNISTQVEKFLNGSGPLTTADFLQAIGYVSLFDGTTEVPDVEHVFHASKPSAQPYQLYKNLARYTNETYETIIKPTEGISQWTIHSLLLHPKSRGSVRLKSASPFDFPIVNANYFTDDRDVTTLVRAVEDMFRIANTNAMKKYNSTAIKVCHPACNCSDWGSDKFWRCMVLNLANTVFHYSGTAKMGPICDKNSVVNNNLKVHGIKKLRVADCSVIPVPTSGHTNAVAYMIGEKASDLIKQTYCNNLRC